MYTPIDQFKFTIDKDDHIILTKYIGKENIVNVAPTYIINNKEYKVEKINQGCFLLFRGKLKLPNGIKLTESNFFENDIEEIELPSDITEIPKFCFYYCDKLKKITLSEKIEKLKLGCFLLCEKLKEINIPKNIKEIEDDIFVHTDIKLNDFENQYIKIENNNIYRKEKTSDNKIIYILNNCYQKNDTLILKENKILEIITNNNLKNIVIESDTMKNCYIEVNELDNLIFTRKINSDYNIHIKANIKNLYLPNETNKIGFTFNLIDNQIKNIYFNNSKEKIIKLVENQNIDCNNIIYKKDINQLLEDNYNFKQIDLIIKGYEKGILLSNINKNIDESILRNIINNFTPKDLELYNILKLLQKENMTLEDQLEIQKMIKNKTNHVDIKNKEIEI